MLKVSGLRLPDQIGTVLIEEGIEIFIPIHHDVDALFLQQPVFQDAVGGPFGGLWVFAHFAGI